ncbi:MAG: ATP-binding protein [Lachnospiraceae bacterium]|nr:ATP-binding protein [Lachnospiraceae bacterium]
MSIAEKEKYRSRVIDEQVERYLNHFGAVCIEGPKWCGKTWTSSFHSKSEIMLGDPTGNFQNRALAETAPELILSGPSPRLIDEWQEVPSLWDAVRYAVDQSNQKGRFILTGSSTPQRKGILHSGAGRIGKLRMRTMSLFESGDSSGAVSLKELCQGCLTPVMTGSVRLPDLIYFAVRGGWPGNLGSDPQEAQILPAAYLQTILDDDIGRIDTVRYDSHKMELLLRSLARNESTTVSNSKIAGDIAAFSSESVDRGSIVQYLDALSRLFLLDNQPPFSSNVRSSVRVKQAEKRHFCDPALACALLKASPERLLNDLSTFGFIFEALCERDLKIYAESFDAKLYHYQDYKNREIDAVIELENGEWCAFEIKLGAHQIDAAAAELLAVQESFRKEKEESAPKVLCVICGMSNAAYRRPDGVFVVPITALKN